MIKYIGKAVGLPIVETTINFSSHEKNDGALILAKTFPPKFTPEASNMIPIPYGFVSKS